MSILQRCIKNAYCIWLEKKINSTSRIHVDWNGITDLSEKGLHVLHNSIIFF